MWVNLQFIRQPPDKELSYAKCHCCETLEQRTCMFCWNRAFLYLCGITLSMFESLDLPAWEVVPSSYGFQRGNVPGLMGENIASPGSLRFHLRLSHDPGYGTPQCSSSASWIVSIALQESGPAPWWSVATSPTWSVLLLPGNSSEVAYNNFIHIQRFDLPTFSWLGSWTCS